MATRSRGAEPATLVRQNYPHRVKIEADLLASCGVNITGGWKTVHRFTERATINGIDYVVYRFSDEVEARRFGDWTIGAFMEPGE